MLAFDKIGGKEVQIKWRRRRRSHRPGKGRIVCQRKGDGAHGLEGRNNNQQGMIYCIGGPAVRRSSIFDHSYILLTRPSMPTAKWQDAQRHASCSAAANTIMAFTRFRSESPQPTLNTSESTNIEKVLARQIFFIHSASTHLCEGAE